MFYYFLVLSILTAGLLAYELKKNQWHLDAGSKTTLFVLFVAIIMTLVSGMTK